MTRVGLVEVDHQATLLSAHSEAHCLHPVEEHMSLGEIYVSSKV